MCSSKHELLSIKRYAISKIQLTGVMTQSMNVGSLCSDKTKSIEL